MKILDRLPISDRPHVITVGEDAVQVNRNQIIVWVSINDVLRTFPAILDTGHGHNFTITEELLRRWAGAELERLGEMDVNRKRVVQYDASLSLHRNVPKKTELRGESYPLETPAGISVVPEGPRLPLLGLRVFVANKLKLVIDGKNQHVTVTA